MTKERCSDLSREDNAQRDAQVAALDASCIVGISNKNARRRIGCRFRQAPLALVRFQTRPYLLDHRARPLKLDLHLRV